jgi:segregation and condensation protein B
MTLKQVVEALVFASPKPLLMKEILAALRAAGEATEDQESRDFAAAKEEDVLPLLAELQAEYTASGRAYQIVEQVNGWTFATDPRTGRWVRQLYPEAKPTRLSGPALETLAIIAYRQPVTRADVEAVRGVAVDGVMQVLLDRSLVKIAGRAEVPGRPLLYQTTEYFLQHFGLKTVDELPNARELKRVPLPKPPVPAEPEQKPAAKLAAAAEPRSEAAAELPETPAGEPPQTQES